MERGIEEDITSPVDLRGLFVREQPEIQNGPLQAQRPNGLCFAGCECRSHLDQTYVLSVPLPQRSYDPKNCPQVFPRIIAAHVQDVDPAGPNRVAIPEGFERPLPVGGPESGRDTVVSDVQTLFPDTEVRPAFLPGELGDGYDRGRPAK